MGGQWDLGSIEAHIHNQGAETSDDLSRLLILELTDIQRKLRQIEHGSPNSLSPFVEHVEREEARRYMALHRTVTGTIDHASLQQYFSRNANPGPCMRAIGSAVGYFLENSSTSLGTV